MDLPMDFFFGVMLDFPFLGVHESNYSGSSTSRSNEKMAVWDLIYLRVEWYYRSQVQLK